jgi:hypothetical protein
MDKRKYYKLLFLIAGIYNIGMSILSLAISPQASFGLLGMSVPASLFYFNVTTWCVIGMGVGYLIVSRDIAKNYAAVVLGAIGKTSYFVSSIVGFANKEAGTSLVVFGCIDLFFTVLFVEFLLWLRKNSAT